MDEHPEPLPPLRRATTLFIGASVVVAMALAGLLAWTTPSPTGDDLGLLVGAALAVALTWLAPLNLAHRTNQSLDLAVLTAAVLLLPPVAVPLAAAAGMIVAIVLRRQATVAEAIFNIAQTTIRAGAGVGVAWALGWTPGETAFRWPHAVVVTASAWLAMYLLGVLLVAGVVALEERLPIPRVAWDTVRNQQSAELFVHLTQPWLGLLAAVIELADPWGLILLLLPGVAIYVALKQHVVIRHRAETSLAEAQQLAALGSFDWRLTSHDQRWSDELFAILGLDRQTANPSRETYLATVSPDDRQVVQTALDEAAAGAPYAVDHRIVRPDGTIRFIHSRGKIVRDGRGSPARVVGSLHDVTERKLLEQRLEHQAYHDALTGLPNRAYFSRRLDEVLTHDGRGDVAVLFLDLDRFKLINDTLGHEAGDRLLIEVAGRLQACVGGDDVVSRLGGDEFTLLLLGIDDDRAAAAVAERVIAALGKPIEVGGERRVTISTSIGVVRPGPERVGAAELLRDADAALYEAKTAGRNRVVLFDAAMSAALVERMAIETDLRTALAREELRVHYQPKVELATGRLVALEALLRWARPTRGWIGPARFVPIAEEIGLIGPIGRWLLATACRDAAGWAALLPEPPVLSVNLSAKQFHDPALVDDLTVVLGESGLPPTLLRLEVAEGAVMQNVEATLAVLGALDGIGVRVVIDDFGTGSSSLSSLRRLGVDTLQLDRRYVADLDVDPDARMIARAVIGLAHGLGLTVVAEGVERAEQVALLRAVACDQAQGNYFAAPMEPGRLTEYLLQRGRDASRSGSEVVEGAGEMVLSAD